MWDASKYEVKAIIKRDGALVAEVPLKFAGRPSLYTASFTAGKKGRYDVAVYAYDSSNGNTGIDRTSFIVK